MFQREEPRKGYNQIKAKPKFKSIKNNGTWCRGSTSNLLGSEGLYLYSSVIYRIDIFCLWIRLSLFHTSFCHWWTSHGMEIFTILESLPTTGLWSPITSSKLWWCLVVPTLNFSTWSLQLRLHLHHWPFLTALQEF